MEFSRHFAVKQTPIDDWFNPNLSRDTLLYVDPFFIFEEETDEWEGAHEELVRFFNLVLKLLAKSKFKKTSAHWKAA